jgi:hypothetical protein
MWKKKRVLIPAIIIAVCLILGSAGAVLAQTGTTGQSKMSDLLTRVAAIYKDKTGTAIDAAKLQESMTQAQQEMRDKALDDYLQKLIDDKKITSDQAKQYKDWLAKRPDTSQYQQQLKDWQQTRPGIPPAVKDWENARPNIPMPGPFGIGPRMRGFGR